MDIPVVDPTPPMYETKTWPTTNTFPTNRMLPRHELVELPGRIVICNLRVHVCGLRKAGADFL
jgi:hypothetical protein